MEIEKVLTLINAVSESSLTSFTMEDGDTKLTFGADRKEVVVENAGNVTYVPTVNNANVSVAESQAESENGNVVESPLVGIFYSAPGPEEKAFVSVGDRVTKGQVLGIVEAMKLMNEIECEYDGVVKQILVKNEQMVEYGQPMFVIE